jgi:Putative prokaryotic signal transducing protein
MVGDGEEVPMIELLRSDDPVLLSFATSLLAEAGIAHHVADRHVSLIGGSIGDLLPRLLVDRERYDDAARLLADAGVDV